MTRPLARLFGLDLDRIAPLTQALLGGALAVVVAVFVLTLSDVIRYAGVDLRNRIVGARVVLAGHDPYTFVWQPGQPETLYDPVYDAKAHRLTASPPTLLLYAPLAPLPYRAGRLVHFALEWAALLASLAFLARCLPDGWRVAFLLGAVVFFVASDFWRIHLERGQLYAFQLLALSAALLLLLRAERDSWLAGVPLGLLVLVRPNHALLAAALLVLGRWRAVGSCAAVALLGIGATALVVPASAWANYQAVGEQYYRALWDYENVPDRPRTSAEPVVEGVDFRFALAGVESSSLTVLYEKVRPGLGLPHTDLGRLSKGLLVLFGLGSLALVAWRRHAPFRAVLGLAVALTLATDVFLPHRWAYVDVLLLAPFAVLLPLADANGETRQTFTLALAGLLAGQAGLLLLGLYPATMLRSWLVLAALARLGGSVPGPEIDPGRAARREPAGAGTAQEPAT